jgi:hypothetical protein
MADFQSTVVSIAVVLLIIILIFIGISLYRNKKNFQYPPVAANCPDYWLDESNGEGVKCVNPKNLGNKDCNKTLDFSAAFWSSDKGLCMKKSLANRCDLTWDGITNNNTMVC